MKRSFRRFRDVAIGGLMILGLWSQMTVSAKPTVNWPSYRLRVTIAPEKHTIKGEARITVPHGGQDLSIKLRKDLRVTGLKVSGRRLRIPSPVPSEKGVKWTYQLKVPRTRVTGETTLDIVYEGEIFDAITNPEKGTFVIGGRTTGIISEEGVYLDDESGWYPRLENGLGLYEVEVTVPDGWVAVAVGDTVESGTGSRGKIYRFSSDVPFDGMVVVAGKYQVVEKKKGAILMRAVFYPEDIPLANLFLEHLEKYLDKYENLFGFYPYQKFDIVENFFTTGYSFPTFTLLGKDVIKMGERALQPGYLDHELVHSWFGNYLYFKPGTGNWVEGLTTYFANYYAREEEGPEAARAYRFGQMQRYSVRVTPDKEYPLRRFEGKQEDFENDIGYGKASMFFHLLSRMLGSDMFLVMVRDMIHHYGGNYVDWEDFRKEMEPILRADLKRYFSDWLDTPGIPDLRVEDVRVTKGEAGGFAVVGKIIQSGHPYSLNVPIRLHLRGGGSIDRSVWIDNIETPFRVTTDRMVERLELDPDYHIMRRIPREEMPPGLNVALATGSLLVLVPESAGAYLPLIDRLKDFPGVVVETAVAGREFPKQSFLLIGRHDENPLSAAWGPMFRDTIEPGPEGIKIKGKFVNAPEDAVMVWAKNPLAERQFGGIFWGNSEEALRRARFLPYYGWDSVVVFEGGRPVFRWTPMEGYAAWSTSVVPLFLPPSESRLKGVAGFLTRSEMKGRRAGTPEADEAAQFIADLFRDAGLKPFAPVDPDTDFLQPFQMEIIDFDPQKAPLSRVSGRKSETIDYWPFMGSPQGKVSWTKWVGISGVEDLANVVLSDDPFAVWISAEKLAGWKLEDWFALTELLRVSGGTALVIVGNPDAVPGIPAPYFDYPSKAVPWPEAKERSASPRKEQRVYPLLRHAKNQANLLMPVHPLTIPIIVIRSEDFETRKVVVGTKWTLDLKFERLKVPTANVVGYLPATEDNENALWVVVGAHYDHLGVTEEGVILPGAVDNAAGVAAVVETAHLLSASPFPRNHHVVFVAFSGEEWGLRGSQAFVSAISSDPRVPYMVNVDAVGGREEPEIYLIGASRFEGLARIAEQWASLNALSVGKNIDRFALVAGSDFWPFLEAGIPVMGVFDADYTKMDQPEDDFQAIQFSKLVKIVNFLTSFIYDLASR